MAITPQRQKGEPGLAELEHAYQRARSIGLFLVEKYARETLRVTTGKYSEFMVDTDGSWGFLDLLGSEMMCWPKVQPLWSFMQKWSDTLELTREPMRFTADGPVRREW